MTSVDPTRPSRAAQQERSHHTVRRILDATLALLERDGVEGVTTNHIAAQAGLSPASLYRFFPNKQAVIYAAYSEWIEELGATVAALAAHWTPHLTAGSACWPECARALADALGEGRRGARVEYELLRAMFSHRALRARDEAHTRDLATAVAALMRLAGSALPEAELLDLAAFANEQFTLSTELAAGRPPASRARMTELARAAHLALWRSAIEGDEAAPMQSSVSQPNGLRK